MLVFEFRLFHELHGFWIKEKLWMLRKAIEDPLGLSIEFDVIRFHTPFETNLQSLAHISLLDQLVFLRRKWVVNFICVENFIKLSVVGVVSLHDSTRAWQ